VTETDLGDVFVAGERVELSSDIDGAAHLAGRRVTIDAAVGGDAYAFGQDVRLAGPVTGAATLGGYDVTVDAAVTGNLRAAGRHVTVAAPVSGAALIFAQNLRIDAPIAGDAVIGAERISFGPEGRIDGAVTLYADDDAVAALTGDRVDPARVDRRGRAPHEMRERLGVDWGEAIVGVVVATLVLALLAALVKALAPRGVERLGAVAAAAPWRALWMGFLALSTLIGAAFVLALTLIGLLAAPVLFVAAGLLAILGYVIGVYLLGTLAWSRFGGLEADSLGEYALVALIGAVLATLVGLVPFLGWLTLLALALVGIGALAIAALRPTFGD